MVIIFQSCGYHLSELDAHADCLLMDYSHPVCYQVGSPQILLAYLFPCAAAGTMGEMSGNESSEEYTQTEAGISDFGALMEMQDCFAENYMSECFPSKRRSRSRSRGRRLLESKVEQAAARGQEVDAFSQAEEQFLVEEHRREIPDRERSRSVSRARAARHRSQSKPRVNPISLLSRGSSILQEAETQMGSGQSVSSKKFGRGREANLNPKTCNLCGELSNSLGPVQELLRLANPNGDIPFKEIAWYAGCVCRSDLGT